MAARAILKRLLGEYEYYRILRVDPAAANSPRAVGVTIRRLSRLGDLQACPHSDVAKLVAYDGAQAACFVAEEGGSIAAACWYWFGETYQLRNFWALRPGEAKLVQITTAAPWRGRGIAEALISHSAAQMFEAGFEALYARVWHSHRASLRAFEKAGWRDYATVLEAWPLRRHIRVVWWA